MNTIGLRLCRLVDYECYCPLVSSRPLRAAGRQRAKGSAIISISFVCQSSENVVHTWLDCSMFGPFGSSSVISPRSSSLASLEEAALRLAFDKAVVRLFLFDFTLSTIPP